MKKLLWQLLSLTLLFTACTKEEGVSTPETFDNAAMRFYGVKLPEQPSKQGAAQHDRLWHNGTTIKVKFLNGSADLQNTVKTYAKEWEEYANITFKFVDSGDAHVRVGFDWNDNRYVTWSYIGTDCKTEVNQSEATLSFAYLEYLPDEQSKRADVLRAFGQVLGLELESRNTNFNPTWSPNPNLTPNYWAFNITDVMWSELKKYVFDPLDADNAISTEVYDAQSIMKWPFPPNILLNGGGASQNYDLSDTDKLFISELYPYEEIVTIRAGAQIVTFATVFVYPVKVSWGDGKVDFFNKSPGSSLFTHTYDSEEMHTIRMYGRRDAIKALYNQNGGITQVDVSKNMDLDQYGFGANPLKVVDISNNTKLTNVSLHHNPLLTEVDISNNPLLRILVIQETNIATIDISKNVALEHLSIRSTPLEQNQAALIALAHMLPDRTGLIQGAFHCFPQYYPEIEDICAAKNWYHSW